MKYLISISVVIGGALLYFLSGNNGNSGIFSAHYLETFGLVGALALSLAGVLGYRFWRSRNRRGNKLFAPTPRRKPSVTLIAVLLGTLSYAATVQFLGKGIESWFDVHVEKPRSTSSPLRQDSGQASLRTKGLVEVAQPAPSPVSDEKTGLKPDLPASPPPALHENIAPMAPPLAAKEASVASSSYEAFGLAAALALSLAGVLGYRFWRSRNRPGNKLFAPTPRSTPSFALITVLMGILSYAAMVQFLGKGIESWFDVRVEKPRSDPSVLRQDSGQASLGAKGLVEMAQPAPPPVLAEQVAPAATLLTPEESSLQAEPRPERPEVAKGKAARPAPPPVLAAQAATPLTAKESRAEARPDPSASLRTEGLVEVARPAPSASPRTKGLVEAARPAPPPALVAQATTPLTAKEGRAEARPDPSASLKTNDLVEAARPAPSPVLVAQAKTPLTANESSSASPQTSNVSLPDKPDVGSPQPAAYKSEPVYRYSRRARKTSAKYAAFSGSLGVDSENYKYSNDSAKQERQLFRTYLDLNGRGFIWDPRLATYNAGISLQKNTTRTTVSNANSSRSDYNLLGYRINTSWFSKKPYAMDLYANRSHTTVSDYLTPASGQTSTGMGARWNWTNKWAGQMRFYLDRIQTDSDSPTMPRSDRNLSFGVDSTQKLRPKQWGESDVGYGYRRNEMNERVSGSNSSQDYLYLNDYSQLDDRMNLRANLTYSNLRNQFGNAGSGGGSAATGFTSSFFNFNSGLSVRQNEKLDHSYSVGLSMNETAASKTLSQSATGNASYRFNNQWQANGSLGLGSSKTDSVGSPSQTSSTTSGSGGVSYFDKFGVYMVNGGYSLSMSRSDSSQANATALQNTSHSATAGYTRTGSPRYTDSLQLRMSQTMGGTRSNDANVRYSVNSIWSPRDALQGSIDYRTANQSNTLLGGTEYSTSATGTSMNAGWQHRFSDTANMILSLGASQAVSNGVTYNSNNAQLSAAALLRSNLQWTALVRREEYKGEQSSSGSKLTLESDLNYRLGKWQAAARYRYSDARLQTTPFKEQSVFLTLKRAYDFNF